MKAPLALLALSLVAGTAQAADNGFYIGVGVGSSKFDVDEALDDSDLGLKAIAGVRLLDSFALEASYIDFGKATSDVSDVKATALGAFALGFLHFPLLDVFAKAGLAKVDVELGTGSENSSDEHTDFAWGLGAQAHFGSFAVRGEFEQYQLFSADQRLLSLSFIYTFL